MVDFFSVWAKRELNIRKKEKEKVKKEHSFLYIFSPFKKMAA
jgi:hypothetical protein